MKETFQIINLFLFLFFELAFAYRAYKKRGFKGKNFFTNQGESFFYAIIEPWQTKYKWGGIIQLIFLFFTIFLQIL